MIFFHPFIDDYIIIGGIMIILHNHQLQNQCFRPSTSKARHHSTDNNNQTHIQPQRQPLEHVIQLRKSYSSASPANKKEQGMNKEQRNKFHLSNWMANHFLCDVKQKFKEIYKQKNSCEEGRRNNVSSRKNSTPSGKKAMNLSINCQPAAITDKKVLYRSQIEKTVKSKRLIDIKKGKIFKGTHRDYNEFVRKQMNFENIMSSSHFQQHLNEDCQPSDEDLQESYLRSQYVIMQRKKQEKDDERIKTQKRTIQPASQRKSFPKYESQMLVSSLKKHSPSLFQNSLQIQPKYSQSFGRKLFPKDQCKLNNDDHFVVYKRNALTRRQQRKRHHNIDLKSKVSLQLNAQS